MSKGVSYYTAVQIKNCLKSIFVIKVVTINTDDFCYVKEAITCYHQIDTLLSAKMNGTQMRTLDEECTLQCAEIAKKIKPVAFAVIFFVSISG